MYNKDEYHLADLTDSQHEKINALEDELGVVLIAWKADDKNYQPIDEENYYGLYENDRM